MANISFLGMGAMGSRMALRLLAAHHEATIWNRTPGQAGALIEAGAREVETPVQAAANADFVITMVRDDIASKAVWLDTEWGALKGMRQGAVAIESSTVSPDWIRELEATARASKISLIEAPVSGSLAQAAAGELIYFVGGEGEAIGRVTPILSEMGMTLNLTGPIGTAALVKLATNALLGVQVAALAELITMLRRSGNPVTPMLEAIASTPVWSPVAHRLTASMLSGDFTPQFPIALMAKDLGYALNAAGSIDVAPLVNATRQIFARASAEGLGERNMTGIIRLLNDEVCAGD